jgi:hypothetical protein
MFRKKSEKTSSIRQDPAVRERIVAAGMGHQDFGIRRLALLLKSAAAPAAVGVPIKGGLRRTGKHQWVFRVFKAAFLCLAIYVGAGSALKIRAMLHQEPQSSIALAVQSIPDVPQVQAQARSKPLEEYRVIWERNLFKVSEQVKRELIPKNLDIDKIAAAENNIGLKLIGTVLANDPSLNYAIIDVAATRRQAVFREKESVGEFLIRKILRTDVILETAQGQIKRLSVDNADLRNIGAPKALPPFSLSNSKPIRLERRSSMNPP